VTMVALGPPPLAPGSLTAPPPAPEVLHFLDALGHWRDDLRAALRSLDRRAQASAIAGSYTADLELALSLWQSIDRRTTDLVAAWDSGRVGRTELGHLAELMWGRLPDALGNPSAFTLGEATTLAAALEARLVARLDADAISGSGAAEGIQPLREAIARCQRLAATLGRRGGEADVASGELETALNGGDQADVAAAVTHLTGVIDALERDLIKEASLRSTVEAEAATAASRIVELTAVEAEVRDLARRCTEKITTAPHLAVPDVAALGPAPGIPDGAGDPGTWRAARAELEGYLGRLDRVAAAFAEARRRFEAPLDERGDLRGLLTAYRDRANRFGLAEDPALAELFEQARAALWTAPCDLARARPLVAAYQKAVRTAVGADEPPRAEQGDHR